MSKYDLFFNVYSQFWLTLVNMKATFGVHLTIWWKTYTFGC